MRLAVFNEEDEVLLLGEGNFSFALDLFKKNLNIIITASGYETEVNNVAKKNVEILEEKGVRVLLGVDATNLKSHPELRSQLFDKIIFNFPHVGGKMRIEKNRNLLKNFFISARDFLKLNGQIIMTLCNGQGGTPADNPRRSWNDSWKVVEMAAHGNFLLTEIEPFQVSVFENYLSTGYRSLEKQFNTEGSLLHFFKLVRGPEIVKIAPKVKLDLRNFEGIWKDIKRMKEKEHISDPISLYPLSFLFDITFSIREDFSVSKFFEVLHNFAGRIIDDVEFIGSYKFFDCDKETRTCRILYRSNYIPLYRKRTIDIHENIVAKIIEDNLNVTVTR
ncbi:ferredoxin-fold anticodon-binding domain-containing protein 1 homolog [Belonocnema kinseyi]|uniref:ferredoxin-fold anticodon-binding domain-containing protein 1 homolog n=1 Tax=Belonocnema kinseyi TaxID=2817044 RepID=UPI00143CEA29|nr:ferredoxin-fold anticodon-binding domain-containing protein 1 homolog [Belonocnema kinseyi]